MKHITYKKKCGTSKNEKGFGVIEAVIALAIIAGTFTAILQLAFLERRSQDLARQDIAAYMLARESLEATRTVRDDGWSNLSNLDFGTAHYPVLSSGVWGFSQSNPGLINGRYTRWIEVSEVFRDDNDNIATSGTADAGTRLVTARVSWIVAGGTTRTIELSTYLTNWQGN